MFSKELVKRLAKIAAAAVALSTYKSLPLMYYFRFYGELIAAFLLRKYLPLSWFRLLRPVPTKQNLKIAAFRPVTTYTYNSLFECDMFFHKSNSTYSIDLDIARTKLLCNVLYDFFVEFDKQYKAWPYMPVASIEFHFKKEIKPYQKYNIESNICSWDDKWLFVMSKFVTYNKGVKRVNCVAVTKYVIKQGRKTIPPREVLKMAGVYSEEAEKAAQGCYHLMSPLADPSALLELDLYK